VEGPLSYESACRTNWVVAGIPKIEGNACRSGRLGFSAPHSFVLLLQCRLHPLTTVSNSIPFLPTKTKVRTWADCSSLFSYSLSHSVLIQASPPPRYINSPVEVGCHQQINPPINTSLCDPYGFIHIQSVSKFLGFYVLYCLCLPLYFPTISLYSTPITPGST